MKAKIPYFLKTIKPPYVIIMIGPPLVGKSTAIKKWQATYDGLVSIISRDSILLEVANTDDYTKAFKIVNQKKVDEILIKRIEEANINRDNVILDMTHLSPKRRKYHLSFFDDEYTKVAVIFDILEWNEFIRRNEKRNLNENKFIPENVIKTMINSYIPPSTTEGFDKIFNYE